MSRQVATLFFVISLHQWNVESNCLTFFCLRFSSGLWLFCCSFSACIISSYHMHPQSACMRRYRNDCLTFNIHNHKATITAAATVATTTTTNTIIVSYFRLQFPSNILWKENLHRLLEDHVWQFGTLSVCSWDWLSYTVLNHNIKHKFSLEFIWTCHTVLFTLVLLGGLVRRRSPKMYTRSV